MIDYHYDIVQGSDEWLKLRLGIITASEMKSVVSKKTDKKTSDYLLSPMGGEEFSAHAFKVAEERLLNRLGENFQTWKMARGQVEEVYAKDKYSERFGQVKECGFITNDVLGFTVGFSPDGLVGDDGFIEIKSRDGNLQVITVLGGEVPDEYMMQIQAGFFVSKRKWCDFISYSNGLHMFKKRVEPIPYWQEKIEEASIVFNKKVETIIDNYKQNVKRNGFLSTEWIDHHFDEEII